MPAVSCFGNNQASQKYGNRISSHAATHKAIHDITLQSIPQIDLGIYSKKNIRALTRQTFKSWPYEYLDKNL